MNFFLQYHNDSVGNERIEIGWAGALVEAIETLRIPTIILTTSHEDLCMPYRSYAFADYEVVASDIRAVDKLLNSEWLVMWYGSHGVSSLFPIHLHSVPFFLSSARFTKNPCLVHPKLAGVPIGPPSFSILFVKIFIFLFFAGMRWHPHCMQFHCDVDAKLFHSILPYANEDAARRAFER